MKRVFYLYGWIILAFLAGTFQPSRAQEEIPLVLVLTVDGAVTPAMVQYLARGIRIAEQRQAEVLVFQLNTPGGSITLMNEMEQDIRASRVPVVVYVSPRGAMAGSAGTIITLAGHASAMAPETIIGAASPIGGQGEDLGETAAAKEKNAMIATIKSLMEDRPPEAVQLAIDTVENARAASATEAFKAGMVDFIAENLDDLLVKLNGFTVKVLDQEVVLNTARVQVEPLRLSFIEQILMILTDPNIVFLLITIGVQAILIELSSPGGWVAGFIGVVSLALATYGLGVLPVNLFGLIFLGTAFVLFLLEIKAPTHGALTTAGVGSLIVGALVLFNSPGTPTFQRVSVPLVIGTSLVTAAVFLVIILYAIRAQRVPIRTGQESLVGREGFARSDLAPAGSVHLGAELWTAELEPGQENLPKGARVVVVKVDGLHLIVKKAP